MKPAKVERSDSWPGRQRQMRRYSTTVQASDAYDGCVREGGSPTQLGGDCPGCGRIRCSFRVVNAGDSDSARARLTVSCKAAPSKQRAQGRIFTASLVLTPHKVIALWERSRRRTQRAAGERGAAPRGALFFTAPITHVPLTIVDALVLCTRALSKEQSFLIFSTSGVQLTDQSKSRLYPLASMHAEAVEDVELPGWQRRAGEEGLDRNQRLAPRRFLYLSNWREVVICFLVAVFSWMCSMAVLRLYIGLASG